MPETQDYCYKPLGADSIRLFGLEDSHTSDALPGTLKAVRLDEAPPYFAISYAWGTQKHTVPLVIDGQLLCVSPSLAAAIRRIKEFAADQSSLDTHIHWVWID